MRIIPILGLALLLAAGTATGQTTASQPATSPPAGTTTQPDEYTLIGPHNFLDGYPALAGDGQINVVIEIPAGTNAKWEVRKEDGVMAWEFKKGKPRVVKYLPYPGNYGMVPRTLLSKEDGGDGDPLDVIVLGPAVERGTVLSARPVGILRLLDGGEIDDKVLAIAADAPLDPAKSGSIDDLREHYPGILDIVEIWFVSYKRPGEMESLGYADREAAWGMIRSAAAVFEAKQPAPAGAQ